MSEASEYKSEYVKGKEAEFKTEKETLIAILNGDEEYFKNDGYDSLETYLDENILCNMSCAKVEEDGREVFKAHSGFDLNEMYKCKDFFDDRAYVCFESSSSCDYVIDTNGSAFIVFNGGDRQIVQNIDYKTFENSALYSFAESVCGESFYNNNPHISEDYQNSLDISNLGYTDFEDFLNSQTHLTYDTEVVSFEKLVNILEENDFDLTEAVRAILVDGAYSACDCDGVKFTKEDFIKDIETHIASLEKISLQSDFEEACRVFNVNVDKLVEFDFDDIESELAAEFEPEVKKKNKLKP